MASSTDIILISSDEGRFDLSLEATELSTVIVEKLGKEKQLGSEVVLDKVDGDIPQNIVTFLVGKTKKDEEGRKMFNGEFLVAEYCNMDLLFNIAMAAHLLRIHVLEDLISERIAQKIKNKSVEFVREAFRIVNDLTAEQVAAMVHTKARYPWAFEGVDVDAEESGKGTGLGSTPPPLD